jgi:hypothetical protein
MAAVGAAAWLIARHGEPALRRALTGAPMLPAAAEKSTG